MVTTSYDAFGSLKITEENGKIIKTLVKSVISKESHSFSYAPEIITANNRKYVLNFPLRCLFEKKKNYFIIQNELLDITATGKTEAEAELDFNETFDYLYQRLSSLEDSKMTIRLGVIKSFINRYVKEVVNGTGQ